MNPPGKRGFVKSTEATSRGLLGGGGRDAHAVGDEGAGGVALPVNVGAQVFAAGQADLLKARAVPQRHRSPAAEPLLQLLWLDAKLARNLRLREAAGCDQRAKIARRRGLDGGSGLVHAYSIRHCLLSVSSNALWRRCIKRRII